MKKAILLLLTFVCLAMPFMPDVSYAQYNQTTIDTIVDKIYDLKEQYNRSDLVLHDVMDQVLIAKANNPKYRQVLQDIMGTMKNREWLIFKDWKVGWSKGDETDRPTYLELFADNTYTNVHMPKDGNFSTIYFDVDHNTANTTTKNLPFTMNGKIRNDIAYIEVIRDWDDNSYFLEWFNPWDTDFVYNVSEELWNVRLGLNKYVIRWYGKDHGYQRVYNLSYIKKWDPIMMQETDILACDNRDERFQGGLYSTRLDAETWRTIYELW